MYKRQGAIHPGILRELGVIFTEGSNIFPAALMAAEGRSNDMDIEPDGIEVSDTVTVL